MQGGVLEAAARASSLLSELQDLPSFKITHSARSRLSKLLRSEIRFLQSLSSHTASLLNCTNLGYFEAVVRFVQNPYVDAVCAVFQKISVSSCPFDDARKGSDGDNDEKPIEVHVDVVCTYQAKPVWVVVSDRNPKHCYWNVVEGSGVNWRSRAHLLLSTAQSLTSLRPAALLFCFARGVSNNLRRGFEQFGASQIDIFEARKGHAHATESEHKGHAHATESERKGHAHATESVLAETGEFSFHVDEYDWVSITVCRSQADTDIFADGIFCNEIDRNYSQWITFNIDSNPSTIGLNCGSPILKGVPKKMPSQEQLTLTSTTTSMPKNQKELASSASTENLIQRSGFFCQDLGNSDSTFLSFLSMLSQHACFYDKDENSLLVSNLVNLDTTALIALVSEISNGAAPMLVSMCNEDLISKFGNTAQFTRDQAEEELRSPLLQEITKLLENKRPFISESVCVEFKSLVSICGGSQEKHRAKELLKLLPVVPDTPSSRLLVLPETGKIKEKNKVVFGTGDWWQAPTLTANLSFVRAVRQSGMALSILEHKPRALMGEKCS